MKEMTTIMVSKEIYDQLIELRNKMNWRARSMNDIMEKVMIGINNCIDF